MWRLDPDDNIILRETGNKDGYVLFMKSEELSELSQRKKISGR